MSDRNATPENNHEA